MTSSDWSTVARSDWSAGRSQGFSIEEAMRMFDGPLAPPLDQQPNYSIPGAELDREIEQLMQQQQQQLAAGATSPPGEVAPHGGATQQRPPTQQLIVVAPVPLRPQPGQFEEVSCWQGSGRPGEFLNFHQLFTKKCVYTSVG